jgi:hypothetical protein
MASIPANRSNVIYGDSNTQTATIVPTLTDGADGRSLQVVSEISDLNNNQKLVLNDLVYDTRTSDDYPQNQSSNIVAFVGTTQNWQLMKENIMEIDANIEFRIFNNSYGDDAGKTVYAQYQNPFDSKISQYRVNLTGILHPDFNFGYWNQPEFCFLNPITRFEVKMGTNNQVMSRYIMNYKPGILHVAKDKRYITEEIDIMANVGVPQSRGGYNGGFQNVRAVANNIPFNNPSNGLTTTDQKEFCDKFSEKVTELYTIAYLKAAQTTAIDYSYTPLTDGTAVTSGGTIGKRINTNFKIAVPLTYLNSALCTPGYFPPGLPFRYEMEFDNSQILIMTNRSDPDQSEILTATAENIKVPVLTQGASFPMNIYLTYPNSNQGASGGNFLIRRREHMLRQPAQEQINVAWIQKPFLYQYHTFEYYDMPYVNGTNTFFSQEIAISQQRPTQLFIVIFYNTKGYVVNRWQDGTKLGVQNINFYQATACGFRITELKVYISGRQNYYLRTAYANNGQTPYLNGSSGMVKDATNMLECTVNTNTYQDGDESNMSKTKMWNFVEGSNVCVSINPGDMQKQGYIASDQGASVVKLEFNATNVLGQPIENYYTIRVYKKLPEQFRINASKNIETIVWPAAVSDNNIVISATHNLN